MGGGLKQMQRSKSVVVKLDRLKTLLMQKVSRDSTASSVPVSGGKIRIPQSSADHSHSGVRFQTAYGKQFHSVQRRPVTADRLINCFLRIGAKHAPNSKGKAQNLASDR
jgi:hypothetical protein